MNRQETLVTDDYKLCRSVMNMSNGIKIISMNICSIHKNFDSLLVSLQSLNVDFDVLILTECRIKYHESNHILPGYNAYSTKMNPLQNDGVVVFVKKSIPCICTEIEILGANCLKLSLPDDTSILALYRSPSSYNISLFLESLDVAFHDIRSKKNLYLIGDININILENGHPQAEDYLALLALHRLEVGINKPTRINSCIDHIMLKLNKDKSYSSVILQTSVSDHYMTLCSINDQVTSSTNNTCTNKYITKHNIDFDKLNEELINEQWSSLYSCKNVNNALHILQHTLQKLICKNTNVQYLPHKKRKLKPWITYGLLNSIRKRDRLHKVWKIYPDNLLLKQEYVDYRRICNNAIKKTKQNYYKSKLESCEGDSKSMWRLINEAANRKRKDKTIISELNIDGKVTNDMTTMCDSINNYFSTVGADLASKHLNQIKLNEEQLSEKIDSVNIDRTFYLRPTNEIEIIKTINTLKNKDSSGYDGITSKIFKKIKFHLAGPLKFIFNMSFKTGIFPQELKLAVIIPLHKKGPSNLMTNYRPISLLSVISKVLEKIVKLRLNNFFCDIASPNQFGFRDAVGTSDAIAELTKHIVQNSEDRKKTLAVFVDLAKAFDTVSHKILLKKLEALGISGNALRWFSSYLENREQLVKIGSTMSSKTTVNFGVPQGSVLGPLLFIIYLNTFCSLLTDCKTICFADDTVILFADNTWESTFDKAERGLKIGMEWLSHNLLSVNEEKTTYICFAPTKAGLPNSNIDLKIHKNCVSATDLSKCNCITLLRKSSTTYLGLTIDQHLRWDEHVRGLSSKVRKLGYVYGELRNIVNENLLMKIYFALTQSLLNYGIIGWGACSNYIIDKVDKAQKLNLKIIKRKPMRFSTENLFQICKVLTIRKLYIKQTIIHMTKHLNEMPLVSSDRQIRKAAAKGIFQVSYKSTAFTRKHFSALAPRIFNSLPEDFIEFLLSIKIQNSLVKMHIKYKTKKFLSEIDQIDFIKLWHHWIGDSKLF